jgi:drug/metabolite transporter (DMT)-like permease
MTPGLELALGSMIFLGLVDLVYQRGAKTGMQARHFVMLQGWFFAPAVTLYGLATGTLALETALLWGMGAGVFVFIALYHFARALKSGSISVVTPIFRLSFTVTVALAVVLLGEPLTTWKLAGLAFAFVAVWLLLGGESAGAAEPRAVRAALMQALIAMAAMGVANFLYKVGAGTGSSPATFIAGQAAAFMPLSTCFAWMVDRSIRPPSGGWRYGAAAAALFLVALVLLFESLARGEASVLVPITQMGFVISAAFGLAFLGEAFTARKAAGLVLAVAALASLAHS